MTLPEAERVARASVRGATTEDRVASYYRAIATALIAQPLPLVLPNGLPAPEPEDGE